ncbi:phage tail tape measure protein [Mameliella alba]|nr:phage tail tape measure protein [Mameliella alba]MBY6168506.1 phage tail tape measure protein [Mameliella alba]MBY6173525.1 phage tail tape measure protein [Mameliella alba]
MAGFAGRMVATLGLNARGFNKGLKDSESRVQRLGRTIRKIGVGLSVASAGMAVAIRGQLNAADELSKTSQRLGVPIEELSALRHAADMSGVSVGDLDNGLRRFSRNMDDAANGGKKTTELFGKLGIKVKGADGALRPTSVVMAEVAEALSKMPDGAEKTALAFDLFGRSGTQLIPMLNGGKSGLEAMMQEARDLGLVIDQKTGKAAENFNDNLSRLSKTVKGIVIQAMAALAPVLERISGAAVEAATWFRNLSPHMQTVASGAAALALVAGPVALGLGAMLMAVGPLVAGIAALASPLGVAIVGVAALVGIGAYVVSNWDAISQKYPATARALEAVGKVGAEIGEGLADAVGRNFGEAEDMLRGAVEIYNGLINGDLRVAFDGLKRIVKGAVDSAIAALDLFTLGGATRIRLAITNIISNVTTLWPDLIKSGMDIADSIKRGLAATADMIPKALRGLGRWLADAVKAAVTEVVTAAKQLGTDLVNGIAEGITSRVEAVRDTVRGAFRSLIGAAKEEAEVRSPSRVFMRIGRDLMAGAQVGIEGKAGDVAKASAAAAKGAVDAYEDAASQAQPSKLAGYVTQISDAMANAIVQGENMGQALSQVFRQIASSLISSGIQQLVGGLFGGLLGGKSGGGGGLLSGFKGFFAQGGTLGAGQWGIAGEAGPEPVIGPAQILPNSVLAGAGAGAMTLNVNVIGAQGNSEIMAMVRQGVAEGLGQFDRILPDRMRQIQSDPRVRF